MIWEQCWFCRLYSSIEGQWQVASQCDAQRVIVASVAAGHSVASLAELKVCLSAGKLVPAEPVIDCLALQPESLYYLADFVSTDAHFPLI